MTRRLTLVREHLAPLTGDELALVAGAKEDRISFPVLGGCLESRQLVCYVDSMQPTRCMCP